MNNATTNSKAPTKSGRDYSVIGTGNGTEMIVGGGANGWGVREGLLTREEAYKTACEMVREKRGTEALYDTIKVTCAGEEVLYVRVSATGEVYDFTHMRKVGHDLKPLASSAFAA